MDSPSDLASLVERQALLWSGLPSPNPLALVYAGAGTADAAAALSGLRTELRFEDEPSCFTAALHDTKEPGA